MFYYLKIIFKCVYYLNGQKCDLTKSLLIHISNFKTISTLKQFKNGDLLSLSVKMLVNVNHDLYSDDSNLEQKKIAAQRIVMILSFIKVIFRPSKELLISDWVDPEEEAFLQSIENAKHQANMISMEMKEADSMAELSAALTYVISNTAAVCGFFCIIFFLVAHDLSKLDICCIISLNAMIDHDNRYFTNSTCYTFTAKFVYLL